MTNIRSTAYALVDESFGPAGALWDVWIGRWTTLQVDHSLTTLTGLSPTGYTGTKGRVIFIS